MDIIAGTFALVCLAFGVLVVVPNNSKHSWDESVWAFISQQWLAGRPPYSMGTKDVKPPLIYFFGRELFRVLPASIHVFRIISAATFVLSSILVYLILIHLTSNHLIALFGVSIYVTNALVISEHSEVRAESLSHVFSLAALYSVFLGMYLPAGVLCAFAIQSKQSALVTIGAISAYLFLTLQLFELFALLVAFSLSSLVPLGYFWAKGLEREYVDLVFVEITRSTEYDSNRWNQLFSGFASLRFLLIGGILFFGYSIYTQTTGLLSLYLLLYFISFVVISKESFFDHYLLDVAGPLGIGAGVALQSLAGELLLVILAFAVLMNGRRYPVYIISTYPNEILRLADNIRDRNLESRFPIRTLLNLVGGLDRICNFASQKRSARDEQELADELDQVVDKGMAFSNTAVWLFLLDLDSGYPFPFYGLRSRNRGEVDPRTRWFIIDSYHSSPGDDGYPVPEDAKLVFSKEELQVYRS